MGRASSISQGVEDRAVHDRRLARHDVIAEGATLAVTLEPFGGSPNDRADRSNRRKRN